MRRLTVFSVFIASLLPLAASAAEWRQIAESLTTPKSEMFVQRVGVAGPVEHLRLRAEGGDIHCLSVRASFRDGDTRVIFSGEVPQSRPVTLPFEGGDTSIRQLRLRCSGPESSRLLVLADVGRFEGEWDGDSTLERAWSAARSWSSALVNDWELVGGRRFDSRYGESRIPAPETRVAALALKPLGRDARCRSGSLIFQDGKSRKLDLDRDDFLAHDRYHRLELVRQAPLEAIELDCRATNGGGVMIEVFASS